MSKTEQDFHQVLRDRCPLESDDLFVKLIGNYSRFFGRIVNETDRINWERWPVPESIFRSMNQVEDGIVKVNTQRDVGNGDLWAVKMLAPRTASEVIFWPSPTPKVLYLSALEEEDHNFPPYDHSCKPLDDLLMGSVPGSYFTDLSRIGLPGLPKAYGYVAHKLGSHAKAGQQKELELKHALFYKKYGLFGCVPISSREDMFDHIAREDLNSYLIPGSSVAEAFTALARRIGSSPLRSEIEVLKGASWVSQDDRNGTGKLTDEMEAYLRINYPDIYWIECLGLIKELNLNTHLQGAAFPFLTMLSHAVMKMIESPHYKMPSDLAGMNKYWNNKVSHGIPEATLSDISELVIRSKNPEPLKPLPWQAFILFGFPNGFSPNTSEQMLENARLIRKYYPNSWVFMMTDSKGMPVPYNIQSERDTVLKGKGNGKRVTPVASSLQAIVEFAIGEQAQNGINSVVSGV